MAACLALAGCGADRGSPVDDVAAPAQTAPESPASPPAEPTAPAEPPSGAPSPTAEDPVAPPEDPAPGVGNRTPGRQPGPRPSDPAPTTPSPSVAPTERPSPSTPAPRPTPSRTPPPAPEQVGGPSAALAFGQTYVWDNGLAVTAGRPAEVETHEKQEEGGAETTAPPSTTSGDEPADAPADEAGPTDEAGPATTTPSPAPSGTAPADETGVVAVDIVLVNGTDRPINTSIFVAMSSGGADAPLVYDPEAGLTGPPGTTIQPGQRVSFTMGFEVQDPADLTMEVRPAYHYVSALFVLPAGAQG
ncbi:hypothetical protein GCM10022262_31670 [Georgenia daeguensis]|uniref:DUF4352 domain-containing protein n=1 Tax=Georgenia daeguensis TaxID=908355 RepID=A0ABP8EYN9_9MICO